MDAGVQQQWRAEQKITFAGGGRKSASDHRIEIILLLLSLMPFTVYLCHVFISSNKEVQWHSALDTRGSARDIGSSRRHHHHLFNVITIKWINKSRIHGSQKDWRLKRRRDELRSKGIPWGIQDTPLVISCSGVGSEEDEGSPNEACNYSLLWDSRKSPWTIPASIQSLIYPRLLHSLAHCGQGMEMG